MKQRHQNDHTAIAERLKEVAKIEAVLTAAVRQAVLEHARAGRPIPIWRNNQVVWEKPEIEGQQRTASDRQTDKPQFSLKDRKISCHE